MSNWLISASKLGLTALLALMLSACGFHLKHSTPLAFKNIYTNIDLDQEFGANLKRTIQANSPDTSFTDDRQQADVLLYVIEDDQKQKQLSIDAEGRVEEYELDLTFTFEITNQAGDTILEPTTLTSIREIPYNERIVQAKESEITRTFADMRTNLIDLIMRRISAPEVQQRYIELSQETASDGLTESKTISSY